MTTSQKPKVVKALPKGNSHDLSDFATSTNREHLDLENDMTQRALLINQPKKHGTRNDLATNAGSITSKDG